MSYSVSEARKIVLKHGTAFKIYYRKIVGSHYGKLENLENSFQDDYVGEFNSINAIVDYYLDSTEIMLQLDEIKVLNCNLSHFLDYDLLFGELEYYYNIYLCSDTGMYYVFNL